MINEKIRNNDIMAMYQKSENILSDIQNIIETSQRKAYHAVDAILSKSFPKLSTQRVDNPIFV